MNYKIRNASIQDVEATLYNVRSKTVKVPHFELSHNLSLSPITSALTGYRILYGKDNRKDFTHTIKLTLNTLDVYNKRGLLHGISSSRVGIDELLKFFNKTFNCNYDINFKKAVFYKKEIVTSPLDLFPII